MTLSFLLNAAKLFLLDKQAFKHIHKKIFWYVPVIFTWIIASISTTLRITADIVSITSSNAETMMYLAIFFISFIVFYPIAILISAGIAFGLLKIVGGKSDFIETLKFSTSISSITSLVSLIVVIPLTIISLTKQSLIEPMGYIILPVNVVILVWALVTSIVTFSRLHKITYLRTVVALVVIPIALYIILVLLVAAIMGLMMTYYG